MYQRQHQRSRLVCMQGSDNMQHGCFYWQCPHRDVCQRRCGYECYEDAHFDLLRHMYGNEGLHPWVRSPKFKEDLSQRRTNFIGEYTEVQPVMQRRDSDADEEPRRKRQRRDADAADRLQDTMFLDRELTVHVAEAHREQE